MARLEKIFRVKMEEADYNLCRNILTQARTAMSYWGMLPFGKVMKRMMIEWAEFQEEIVDLRARVKELEAEDSGAVVPE